MNRFLSPVERRTGAFLLAGLGSALLFHQPAAAQRTSENAVTSAADGFGNSIGNEQTGIYRDNNVRGFSPITAGNRRLDGLYFDLGGNGLTQRLTASSMVRVGLPALSYLFPAPSGIVDYMLRSAGDEAGVSVATGLSEYGGGYIEADARIPVAPGRLSIAAGGHFQHRRFEDGRDGDYSAVAVIPTLRIDQGSITGFWSAAVTDADATPIFTTTGPSLPPEISGGRLYGQPWARGLQRSQTYGLLARHELTESLDIRFGAFESRSTRERSYTDLFVGVQRDGRATNIMVAEPPLPARWTSGEVRLSWSQEGARFGHAVHLVARGRDKRLQIGGSASAVLGPAQIGEFTARPEPAFAFSPPNVSAVRQWIGGIAYVGRWQGVMEWNLGLQRTDYRSDIQRLGVTDTVRARPWLVNAMLALTPASGLAIYGGYTQGLEETSGPPASAVNRDDAVPASRTSQKEAGLRVAFGSTRIVAGLFEIERPYFSLDERGIYGELGTFRNRGAEFSLVARPLPGLSIVGGLVVLKPEVLGAAVASGRAGPRPVGIPERTARIDLNYRTPLEGLSLDMSIQHAGATAASTAPVPGLDGRQLTAPAATTLDLGGRHRFRVGNTPVALRMLVANVLDDRGYEVRGSQTYTLRSGRRLSLQLTADF